MQVWDDDGNEAPAGEVGEIVIRGHNVMKGYWERPEATEESIDADGWFRSGDMAKVDEDGYFFIVDRKKDLIIRGGYNVYPREVEEILYEHPAVQEAAVVGVPDDSLGEEVAAAVVLKEGETLDEELKAYVKEQVAAYKYPRKDLVRGRAAEGPTGKILKREIEAPAEVRTASRHLRRGEPDAGGAAPPSVAPEPPSRRRGATPPARHGPSSRSASAAVDAWEL